MKRLLGILLTTASSIAAFAPLHVKRSTTTMSPWYNLYSSNKNNNPSWQDIVEVPISVDTRQDFEQLSRPKRIAIVARSSVLHLTLLSCAGPLVFRGALLLSSSSMQQPLTVVLSVCWTLNVLSWHAFHNLLNDWQDLEGDDRAADSFRTDYGCHALKQGYLTKPQFLRLMLAVSLPGILLTGTVLRRSLLSTAAPFGLLALFFYTILFKPIALGEGLIYAVWGPLMAGYGQLAAGATWETMGGIKALFTNPATAQFGLGALCMIMGKHTDKISRSEKKTLPKLLGYPAALWACRMTVIAPHLLLACTFLRERVFGATPTVPIGAGLAFLTLLREAPACFSIFSRGAPTSRENPPDATVRKGWIADFDPNRTWPLWFVATCGWHAVTFLYFMVIGSGLEWGGRVLLSRVAL